MGLNKSFLKKRLALYLFCILAAITQVTETFSMLMADAIITGSGVIRYNTLAATRPLHVEGNKIYDDLGSIVYLRGTNKGNGGDHPSGCWGAYGKYLQSEVDVILNKMKIYGINVIRYFIAVDYWISNYNVNTESGTITFQQMLNDLLTRCEDHEIYFILAPYKLRQGEQQVSMAYPPYIVTEDGATYDPLPEIQDADDFVAFWVNIVDTLGSHNNLIIDPWNEAFGKHRTNPAVLDEWQTVWQNLIDSIRAKEDLKGYVNHLIMLHFGYGLTYWGDLDEEWRNLNWIDTHPLTDTAGNLIYSIHCYRNGGAVGTQTPKENRPTDYATIKAIYTEEGVYEKSQIHPIIVGEIGGYLSLAGEETWLENTYKIWNEWGLNYIQFTWRDTPQFAWNMLEDNTEWTTGGTVNSMGQKLVDAIAQGS
jgi:hypothetical protein